MTEYRKHEPGYHGWFDKFCESRSWPASGLLLAIDIMYPDEATGFSFVTSAELGAGELDTVLTHVSDAGSLTSDERDELARNLGCIAAGMPERCCFFNDAVFVAVADVAELMPLKSMRDLLTTLPPAKAYGELAWYVDQFEHDVRESS